MALIKACIVGNSVKNTGKECDIAMGPTAMIIAVPPQTVITAANLADPLAWIRPLLHADKQSRVYPLFGSVAPINVITNDAEADVEVTLDDGTKVPVRLGVYSRTFETISGGLCYAEALLSFIGAGYRTIEIDQVGRTLIRREDTIPKTWGGMITSYMGGKSPTLATLKDVYRNRFGYSFTPQEMVNNGEIFEGGGPLLGLMGLVTSEVVAGTAASVPSVGTAASGTDTVTAVGADGNSIDVQRGDTSASLSGGPVAKTSSESTVTLLAVKIKDAINAATGTNGGFTATNIAGAITILSPNGTALNGVSINNVIVGSITATPVGFSGGTNGSGFLYVGVQTHCAESDLVDLLDAADLAQLNNFIITNKATSAVVTATAVSVVAGELRFAAPTVSGQTYNVIGAAPSVWYGNDILGYDASEDGVDILVP